MTLQVTRRAVVRALAAISATTGATAASAACRAPLPAEAETLPTALPATQHRYDLARAEFIAATKALHPDVADWRTVSPEDDERIVGHFMIFGRSAYKAVRS